MFKNKIRDKIRSVWNFESFLLNSVVTLNFMQKIYVYLNRITIIYRNDIY